MKAPYVMLVLALAVPLHARDSDVSAKGEALIQQAQDKTNIFALPSFRMDATVRIDNFGKPLDGTYSLLWNGPGQWRQEITFHGYSEVELGAKGTVYLKRNTDFMPYPISQMHATLGFGTGGGVLGFFNRGPRKDEIVKAVHGSKISGQPADCVKIIGRRGADREVCVNQSTGTLIRQKDGFTDTEFAPIESKVFPRSMSMVKDGRVRVEIHVTQLEINARFSSDAFSPVVGARPREGCMNPISGTKTLDVNPIYPQMAKAARIQGVVLTDLWIDKNGAPESLSIISSDNPILNRATLDAVKQWRYQPATCNGTPVETETVTEVRYWIP